MKVRNLIGVLTSILITGAVASCGGNPPAGGISTYVMEAEYINLDGIQGAGLSSDQGGVEMIYGEGTAEHKAKWSNGYYVGYTHSADLQLDFVFNSSSNNTANLVLRLGSELGDIIHLKEIICKKFLSILLLKLMETRLTMVIYQFLILVVKQIWFAMISQLQCQFQF